MRLLNELEMVEVCGGVNWNSVLDNAQSVAIEGAVGGAVAGFVTGMAAAGLGAGPGTVLGAAGGAVGGFLGGGLSELRRQVFPSPRLF